MSIKSILFHSFRIAWKDLMELLRNRLGLVMLVLMPIFMMSMVGFIYPSETSISNISVALANEDAGYGNYPSASATFILVLEQVNTHTGMMVITNATNFDEVRNMIQRGEVEGGIVITSNFTSSLMTGKQGTIIIVADQSNPQMSITLQIALKEVFEQMGTMLAQHTVQQLNSTVNESNSLAVVKPYNVQTEGAVPGNFSYFDFVAPTPCSYLPRKGSRHVGWNDGGPHQQACNNTRKNPRPDS